MARQPIQLGLDANQKAELNSQLFEALSIHFLSMAVRATATTEEEASQSINDLRAQGHHNPLNFAAERAATEILEVIVPVLNGRRD